MVYPANIKNVLFILSLAVFLGGITVILLSLVCYKYTVKPILIATLLLSAAAAYFMDTYNVIIDDSMIDNVVHTDAGEVLDLLSLGQTLYLFFLGVLPSIFIYRADIIDASYKRAIFSRAKLISFSIIAVIAMLLVFSDFYASFFREHKSLRYYTNPVTYLYAVLKYSERYVNVALPFKPLGEDANMPPRDPHRELIVLVVGETARADHFSLNGYAKETNPELEKMDVISFTNFWSCGTSTAVSVPCMFSYQTRSNYDKAEADTTDNILDILQRTGVNVIWLDNNSDSKGVADRVPYVNYKTADTNTECDDECRDVGMLSNLQSYIDSHPKGDIFIVLHQMGNHGPAYFKRYPIAFEKFTPTCQTNQLENCSAEEISNSYDNAILYTDYFLSRTIELLKTNDGVFETAMIYMSDHGESLGESNLYLHGLPYFIAPDAQKKIPVIMWLGNAIRHEINVDALKKNANTEYSHDNLFHTLLGIMEVRTSIYDQSLDLIDHTHVY